MGPQLRWWKPAAVGLLLAGATALAACTGGVSRQDYDAVKQQATTQEQKARTLEQQLAAKDKELEEAKKAAGPAGVTLLMGAKQEPTPTRAPSPTPLPPGAPTPTPRTPPAYLQEKVPFAVYVETLATTSLGVDGWTSTVACTPNAVFKRGMKLVYRFEVIDTATGKRLTDKDATIMIKIPRVDDVKAGFSQRAGGRVPDAPWTWAAGWNIPLDYPVGALDWSFEIKANDGRSMTYKVPALSFPDGSLDSRVKIVA